MNKKLIVSGLLMAVILLSACQKTDIKEESTKQTSRITKKSSTNSTTDSMASNISERQTTYEKDSSDNESESINIAKQQLIGNTFSMGPSLYDGEDATQAMEENKAPQNLMHDGAARLKFIDDSTVHVELAGTYRPDYDTSYKLTKNMLIIEHRNIPYTINNGLISFDTWTTEANGHTITWTFGPDKNASENSSEGTSESTIDTKNLSSEQFKEWVSAVLDKQFSMGRNSFPYKLSVENHDGYAYVRVKHSELEVDTITMFRINDSGQLEEEDRSNGYPVTYKVVSSKFMDTSEVTMQE